MIKKHETKHNRRVNALSKRIDDLMTTIESMQKRIDDLEYFRDNAKILIDIQEIQDS